MNQEGSSSMMVNENNKQESLISEIEEVQS